MRRTKRLGALLIALVMVFAMLPLTTAGAATLSGNIVLTMNSTDFTVNGTKTKIDAEGSKPVQSKGYTMLPLRAILEATGGTLTYDANTKKITIVRGGDTVVLTLDSKTATVNGANRTLGAAPYATNGRTMVHIRTLELFGMRVDWDSKTNNVTVKYVEPTKVYNLTLQNGMGVAYNGIYIAPQGTTAGAAAESGNLLGADTLQQNGNIIVQAPISTPGTYQLRCTYVDPSSKKTQQHIIQNINLSGISDRAAILMNSATTPSVTVDGASAGNSTITIYVVNNTGKAISALYSRQSGAQYYERTNLLGSQILASGGQASFSFNYSSTSPYYDFVASCSPSGTEEYTRVAIGGLGAQTFQTIRLGANGTLDASSSTSTTKSETKVTFENDSDDDIKGVAFSVSSKTDSKWESADTEFGKISAGKSKDSTMDLSESRRWYVCVLDEDGDYLYDERLDFGSTSLKNLTITWDGDEFETDTSSSSSSSDDDTDDFGGNTDLIIYNDMGYTYKNILVLPYDDYDDLKDEEYNTAKKKAVELGKLSKNSVGEYKNALKYKEEEYVLMFYDETDKDSEPDFTITDIEIDKNSKYVMITASDGKYYDSDSDMVLLIIKNSSGEDISLDVLDSDTSKASTLDTIDVDDKDTEVAFVDVGSNSRIYFDVDGDTSKSVKVSSSTRVINVTVKYSSKNDEYTFSTD